MVNTENFLNELKKLKFAPFIHVPCSYLAALIKAAEEDKSLEVINPVNESIAIGIAAGAYLAGKLPVVAIQNSGFLNTLNPLTSLHMLYQTPALIFVSWRGDPQHGDADEHIIVGANIKKYFDTFNLKYKELNEKNASSILKEAKEYIQGKKLPFIILVPKGIFSKKYVKNKPKRKFALTTPEAIEAVKSSFDDRTLYVNTTGAISRFSYGAKPSSDFYIVGSMGMAFPIGSTLARYTKKKVVVFDGDGAFLMHLGATLHIHDKPNLNNLVHVVLDNEAYFSTGNQPTLAKVKNISEIAKGLGYKCVFTVKTKAKLLSVLKECKNKKGPILIHIKTDDIGLALPKRVTDDYTCPEIKERFMKEFKK